MSYQVDFAIPSCPFDDSHGADRPVHCIGSRNMVAIGRPRASSEVRRQGRALERGRDRSFENKVVNHVMLRGVRSRRGKSENLDCAVVARCREVLVGGIKCDALDVTLMHCECLQLLKCVPRPYDDFRV